MSTSSPDTVYVCPLDAIDAVARRARPGYMISLVNEETMRGLVTPPGVPAEQHLRLIMNDIAEPRPDHIAPGREHVTALIDFVMTWDQASPLLINCVAGISRSTAAAFTILCAFNPATSEAHIARLLQQTSPTAQPNRRLVRFADEVLGREGRLMEAAEAIAQTAVLEQARPFALPTRLVAQE